MPDHPFLTFFVPGLPASQGSKNLFVNKSGRPRMVEAVGRVKSWRMDVATMAKQALGTAEPFVGPLSIELTFRFPRPKNHYKAGQPAKGLKGNAPMYLEKTPDLDKLIRAIGDALAGIVYRNDSQLVRLRAVKAYGDEPGVKVFLTPCAGFSAAP